MKQKWPVQKTEADNKEYLVGVSVSEGYDNYPGLKWHILVRQPVDIAYSKARAMYYLIIIAGML